MKITTPPETLTKIEMTYEEWSSFNEIHKKNILYNGLWDGADINSFVCDYSIGGRIIQTIIKEKRK